MPALEAIVLHHCLPPLDSSYSTLPVVDPDPCEASMPLDSWGLPTSLWAVVAAAASSSALGAGVARRGTQLEPAATQRPRDRNTTPTVATQRQRP